MKKLFLEISQNSQENTCARVLFEKVEQLRTTASLFATFFEYSRLNLLVKLQVINLNKAAETICKSQKKNKKVEEFWQITL